MAEIARLFPERDEEVDEVQSGALIEAMRIAEALIFAANDPVDESDIAKRLPEGVTVRDALDKLREDYSARGINLVRVNRKWTFRTAPDLGWLLSREQTEPRKLSRAAIETLAICAYHQPVTRAEIEDIRGVAISKGTLDVLIETGWVRLRGRRKAPGRPVTYGTTDAFLLHFGLETIGDLPGLEELKAAGLFDGRLPPGFGIPQPRDDAALQDDEDPLEDTGSAADLFAEDLANAEPVEGEGDAEASPESAEPVAQSETSSEAEAALDAEPVDEIVEEAVEVSAVFEQDEAPAAESSEPDADASPDDTPAEPHDRATDEDDAEH